jgi:hypothetical protein
MVPLWYPYDTLTSQKSDSMQVKERFQYQQSLFYLHRIALFHPYGTLMVPLWYPYGTLTSQKSDSMQVKERFQYQQSLFYLHRIALFHPYGTLMVPLWYPRACGFDHFLHHQHLMVPLWYPRFLHLYVFLIQKNKFFIHIVVRFQRKL